ncbi:MAG: hypothetical protein JXB32_22485, partial [Deltaproteobacteria bacterium]|nr:hypothetical protein [Deltaproteobacteria bacterium]
MRWTPTLFVIAACFAIVGCTGGTSLSGDEDVADGTTADRTETADDAAADDAAADDAAETSPACEPQDVRSLDPFCGARSLVAWDGRRCVDFPNCGCEGADCAALYETIPECVEAHRACYAVSCEADSVADDACIDCTAEMLLGVFWDGRECFELHGCDCTGRDCDRGLGSLAECGMVHEACDGASCLATGGQWFPAAAGTCGFACGAELPLACESPIDACRCPPGETFTGGLGCAPDPSCTPADLCAATRGIWHPLEECRCDFRCGIEEDCHDCLESCECGPHRTFEPLGGCVFDPSCPAA